MKPLSEEILDLMRVRARAEYEYINPNFLLAIETAIYDYYELEDEEVGEWIYGMFGA